MTKLANLIIHVRGSAWRRFSLIFFFVFLIVLGLGVFRDYGISWDEPQERTTGIVNLAYIGKVFHISSIENSQALYEYRQFDLPTYFDRVFGVGYQLPILILERAFKLQDEQAIYYFRHLANYLVCLLGVYAIFRMAERRYRSWLLGIFTAICFILSPRFFAESFYNVKDLIFLSLFAISVNCLIALLERPTTLRAIGFAISAALAIDVRLMAIMLPSLLIVCNVTDGNWRALTFSARRFGYSLLALGLCGFLTILFWPWLWSDPFSHFMTALKGFSAWSRSDIFMLFHGYYIRSTELPWYYALAWIGITTPLLYLGLFAVGLVQIVWAAAISGRHTHFEQLQDAIFLACITGPLLAVILLHSVIYDGWRHLYFIYPFMLLIGAGGFLSIYQYCISRRSHWWRSIFIGLVLVQFLQIASWMIQAHPMQNLYFNALAGSNWKKNYDLDYWGLSTSLGLRYIAAHSNRPLIKVWAGSSMPLYYALKILDPDDRERFQIATKPEDADYFLTNFRGNTLDYDHSGYGVKKVKVFSIDDEEYLEVYQRTNF